MQFNFDYDPCPLEAKHDGLAEPWGICNFVNPPYSNIPPWVVKSIEEKEKGSTIILLLPGTLETIWFREIYEAADQVRLLTRRLRFGNAKSTARFSSVIFVLDHLPRRHKVIFWP